MPRRTTGADKPDGPAEDGGSAPGQGVLFDDGLTPSSAYELGYRGPTASAAAGITYRQLDYWARTGLVEPSVRGAAGSGTQRLYSFRDILVLKVVKRLLDTGVSLQNIRTAVEHLRGRGVDDLARITLMSDGTTVYECMSADEVVDLLQGGQGVFGIAVGRVVSEVRGVLAELPAERPPTAASDGTSGAAGAAPPLADKAVSDAAVADAGVGATLTPGAAAALDELSSRRRRRTTA